MYQDTPEPAAKSREPLSPEQSLALREQALSLFPTAASLAGILDHTLLRPQATEAQVLTLATEAAEHRFACAMVNPVWVPTAARALAGTGIRVGTVLGFPLGASLPVTKAAEALHCAQAGALDLDMVLSVGALLSGHSTAVHDEIRELATIAHAEGAILKVILETSLLSDEQKRTAATLCLEAGADYIKTSTGFSGGGATVADVRLLREAVGQHCGVKASGGIRTLGDAVALVTAGASRLGASASVAILQAWQALQA